jgi:hypothetical protein
LIQVEFLPEEREPQKIAETRANASAVLREFFPTHGQFMKSFGSWVDGHEGSGWHWAGCHLAAENQFFNLIIKFNKLNPPCPKIAFDASC